jgi:glycine oxidase
VRGERLIVRTREIGFRRPVRFLHPRQSIYVVPWGDGLHMVGATVIESDDTGPITVRSALELLGMAYALHPAFGEAQIVDAGAGVRPAFADNVPKIIVRGQTIHVNGLYRHGFLLAPALAELVANYLESGAIDNRVFVTDPRS